MDARRMEKECAYLYLKEHSAVEADELYNEDMEKIIEARLRNRSVDQ